MWSGSISDTLGSLKRFMALSAMASMLRASDMNIDPSYVSDTDRVVRLNSLAPSSVSSERIWCVTAGWVMFRRSAARAKLSVSATARKQLNTRSRSYSIL